MCIIIITMDLQNYSHSEHSQHKFCDVRHDDSILEKVAAVVL